MEQIIIITAVSPEPPTLSEHAQSALSESAKAAALRARGFRVRMHRAYPNPSVATLIETAPNLAEIGLLLGAVRASSQVRSSTQRKCERAALKRIIELEELSPKA